MGLKRWRGIRHLRYFYHAYFCDCLHARWARHGRFLEEERALLAVIWAGKH